MLSSYRHWQALPVVAGVLFFFSRRADDPVKWHL
jgi:hypothetical protein